MMSKALAALMLIATATASAPGPTEIVHRAVGQLITILEATAPDIGKTGRQSLGATAGQIDRITRGMCDFDDMARRALMRHWASLSATERLQLSALVADLFERVFIARLEAATSGGNQRVVYTGEVVDDDYALVHSRVGPRPTDMAFDYHLHRVQGRWRVYDVFVGGVSFVAARRAEFDRRLRGGSFAALIQHLRQQVETGAVPGPAS